MYQLWLDDLYPKAKFADALAIIEKLGHTKRMQLMRREWIEEGKPKATIEEGVAATSPTATNDQSHGQDSNRLVELRSEDAQRPRTPTRTAFEERDLYGASPTARLAPAAPPISRDEPAAAGPAEQPEEDELDALLAEDAGKGEAAVPAMGLVTSRPAQGSAGDDFEDEMEAMADIVREDTPDT